MALIFVTRKIPEVGLRWMREGGHEVVVSEKDRVLTPRELKRALAERPYDGVVSLLTDEIDETILEAAPQLKIIANYAVGFNNLSVDALKSRGVTITNTPGVLTNTVAEYTVSLILALVKRIVEADAYTRSGKYRGWEPELFLGNDLEGKTLGIVGAGRIGSEVAKRMCLGFGMKVKYTGPTRSEMLDEIEGCEYSETLEQLLQDSDVVSIHAPLLPETTHLINEEKLNLMKSSAFLVNTARGPIIDEKALFKALKNKTIKGAGLDVFEEEPKITAGLEKLDNVIVTPHIASASEETRNKMSELVAYNINEFFLGRKIPNPV